jgi:GNAT superfamily N-acetyltransferase
MLDQDESLRKRDIAADSLRVMLESTGRRRAPPPYDFRTPRQLTQFVSAQAEMQIREEYMIRRCETRDFEVIHDIINDGAVAYKGVIPKDCWREPYMSKQELQHEIDEGVAFWGHEENGSLAGVMGLQPVADVTLIRHAYVRTESRRRGIGAHLLSHLLKLTPSPVLIGTWTDALWAIRFYEKHGFRSVPQPRKDLLLKRYWGIPERQIETSVVLADAEWWKINMEPRQFLDSGSR